MGLHKNFDPLANSGEEAASHRLQVIAYKRTNGVQEKAG